MWETDVPENPNDEKRAWLKTTCMSLAGALITKESQRLCGKYQVIFMLLMHNRSWLPTADAEDPSSQYVYFGLQLAWVPSLNILTTYTVWSSRKDSYSTHVCFLNGGSLDELHHVIHSFNASTDTCAHVRFYTWKQTWFLFPYLFPACLFLLLRKICHWSCYLNLLLPLRPIIAKTNFHCACMNFCVRGKGMKWWLYCCGYGS